jgi:hypothetical protein
MTQLAAEIEERLTARYPAVVAMILEDGTVLRMDGHTEEDPTQEWAQGHVGGPGWMLWWERRRWADQSADRVD